MLAVEKEYLTIKEVADMLGLKRASVYFYIEKLNIKTESFPNNRHKFIAAADAERIKQTRETPWKVEE